MSSNIFDRLAAKSGEEQQGNIFDRLAAKPKEPGIVGGAVGTFKPKEPGIVGGAVGTFIDDNRKFLERSPRQGPVNHVQEFVDFNKKLGSQIAEDVSYAAENPYKAGGEILLGALEGNIAKPIDLLEAGFKNGGILPEDASPNLARELADKAGAYLREGMSPEQVEASLRRQRIGSIIPLGAFVNWFKRISNPKVLPPRPRPPVVKPAAPRISNTQQLTQNTANRAAFFEQQAANAPATEAQLVEGIAGENLPVSRYEVAEQALKETNPAPTVGGQKLAEIGSQPTTSTKSLQGLVKKEEGPGAAISDVEFESEGSGGKGLNRATRDEASSERKDVTKAYEASEKNSANINSIDDKQLLEELQTEVDKIKESVRPNTAESSVLKTIEDILHIYTVRNGLPVRQLIRTSDSISGMSNYELPFTGPKDILKKTATSLDQAAIRAIKANGGDPSLQIAANKKYGQWADRYANDDISPYLEKTVNNPEALYRKTISDEGAFRAIEKALHNSPRDKEYINAIAREIAEKRMGKFKAEQLGSEEYRKALRNLKELIGEKRALAYDEAFRKQAKIPRPSGEKQKVSSQNKLEALIKKIAEHSKKSPELLLSRLDSRSGIKELKKEVSKNNFDIMVKQKARSILQDGKIEKVFTGDQMFQVLNKEGNFEIFVEILGREEAVALREAARAIGKQNMTVEKILGFLKQGGKETAKYVLGAKALKMILPLLV